MFNLPLDVPTFGDAVNLTNASELELLKFVTGLAEAETDRFWTRYRIMAYANTGLVGIFLFFMQRQQHAGIIVPVMGLVTSAAWLGVAPVSHYYYQRWNADLEAILRASPWLRRWVRGQIAPRVTSPILRGIVRFLYDLVPISFLIFWSLGIARSLDVSWHLPHWIP